MERCVDCIHFKARNMWAYEHEYSTFPFEAPSNLCEHYKTNTPLIVMEEFQEAVEQIQELIRIFTKEKTE